MSDEQQRIKALYRIITLSAASMLFCVRHPGANINDPDSTSNMQGCIKEVASAMDLVDEVAEFNEEYGLDWAGRVKLDEQ